MRVKKGGPTCWRASKTAHIRASKMARSGRVPGSIWSSGSCRVTMAASLARGEDAIIERETQVLLRHYLEEGASKAEVARRLRVSRRTVHRWIASGQLGWELDDEAVRYDGGAAELHLPLVPKCLTAETRRAQADLTIPRRERSDT